MSLLTSIVDLDSIQINSASFNPEDKQAEIESLAHSIAELKGLLNIPVVRSLGIDEYELVSGHLEYYAFLKARELDPELEDRMTVFVLKPKNEKAILKQLETSQAVQQVTVSSHQTTSESGSVLILKVSNLEARVDQNARELSEAIEQLRNLLTTLPSTIADLINTRLVPPEVPNQIPDFTAQKQPVQKLALFEAFNRLTEPEVAVQVIRKLEFLGRKKAKKIVEALQAYKEAHQDAEFRQIGDVRQALGKGVLSEKAMLEIISNWND